MPILQITSLAALGNFLIVAVEGPMLLAESIQVTPE